MQPGLFAPFHRVGHTSVNGSERIPLHDQAYYPCPICRGILQAAQPHRLQLADAASPRRTIASG